ncbi:MAG: Rossmann-like domain-containing protein [Fidelibacterota bacterium]
MTVYEKLLKDIPQIPVDEIIVGFFSVLVKAGKTAGIASTIKYGKTHDRIGDVKELERKSLRELSGLVSSDNMLAASLGMAAINCYLAGRDPDFITINAKDIVLDKGRGKTVGVIGHFPFLNKHREQYKELMIFEKSPQEGDWGEEDIPEQLPRADVVALTATTLTNHTFHEVIRHMSPESYKIILGPTTPLSPVLFDYGFHAVCGTVIRDYDYVKKQVLMATPTRYLEGVEYVGMMNDE